jgi:hypothetical protein
MISRKQIALIKIAVKRLGLDDETYRGILAAEAGVDSSRDLDLEGFDRVMARFKRLGFVSDWSKRTFGADRAPGMASPAQVDLIRHLWREWSDNAGGAGIDRWLEGHFSVSSLRFLDAGGAQKAITALRAMKRRKLARATQSPKEAPQPVPGLE